MTTQYIGRFAPSPTGPLHLGSLYTALASYLDAKANKGQWLVRIEDLDPPREQAGATGQILAALEAHGLHWDGGIRYQSQHHADYESAIQQLLQQGDAFFCNCSRSQLKPYNGFYPGFCHHKTFADQHDKAVRFRCQQSQLHFHDTIMQAQADQQATNGLCHDFVIKRRDGLYAYQIAVVLDDINQGVTHIVRGSDILDSTFKQLYLYQALNHSPPNYSHLPVILSNQGQKLSKQNLAPAINNDQACENLLSCLKLLNQPLPEKAQIQSVKAILDWAVKHWNIHNISATMAIPQDRATAE